MKQTLRFTLYALLLALVLAGFWSAPALAQGSPPTDDDVNAIARQLYCPVCENTPLDVCGTQACAQWRDLIRQMLADGKSEAEIKQYFVDNYGARVLNEPPRAGINWLVYIVPPVVIVIGAAFLFRALQTMKKPAETTQTEGPRVETPPDEYVSRLEEELKKKN